MNKSKTLLTKLLLVLALCMLAFTVVACNKPKAPATGEAKTAEYYYAADGGEYTVSLDGTSYTMSVAGDNSEGTFNLQGESIVFNPTSGDAIEAQLRGDELSFTYKGEAYVFLEKIEYTVTFDLDGGAGVSNQTVVNGMTPSRPATSPTKEGGYTFIDWYTSDEYETLYDFTQPVRGNTTVYALFLKNESEYVYSVDLVDGGDVIDTVTTINGVLYNLPELTKTGSEFLGWWYSFYEDETKLAYQYTGQQIGANTSLYAVWSSDDTLAVSMDGETISWTSAGVNVRYTVTITLPDQTTQEQTTTVTHINYAPDETGDYVVTVAAANGASGSAYYRNNGLDKVTVFSVEGNVLHFQPVNGAEGYYLTVVCANEAHDHSEKIDLGNVTEYDFTTCGMSPEGLTFVVEAYAEGYAGSQSDPYVVLRSLAPITDLAVDAEGDIATWTAVENAESYSVTLSVNGEETSLSVNENTVDLSEYSGNITITVVPVARTYTSPEPATLSFNKSKLATPSNFRFQNGTFTWSRVTGATSYVLKIGDMEIPVNGTQHTLTEEEYAASGYADNASVKAVGGNLISDSNYSETINIGEGALSQSFHYSNGKLVWDSVFGATGYSVMVDGEEVLTNQNVNEYALELEKKETPVAIKYFRGDTQSAWIKLTIEAYKVVYDLGTGREETYPVQYAVVGDALELDPVSRVGYDFNGWYLDDQRVLPGTVLSYERDIVVVAHWNAHIYTVTLNVDNGGTLDQTSVNVTFGSNYTLPRPESNNATKAFAGWYTETRGAGICYTSYNGSSIVAWNDDYNVTLYAYWVDIFTFNPISGGTAYSVSQGEGIDYVNTVTIPATYQGLPVTTVEGSAFDGCSKLVEIRIPNSVTNIELGIEGGYTTGSAFNGTRNLLNINVYVVENVTNPKYKSENGVLYEYLSGGGVSLAYYPKYREGALILPDDVTEIPRRALYSKTYLTELVIPASIRTIGNEAFRSCSDLTKITFIDAGADAPVISIGEGVFTSCSDLTDITLPSNISGLSATMFDGCSNLENIVVSENNPYYTTLDGVLCEIDQVTHRPNKLVYFPKGRGGEYTIPVGITTIGANAFYNCENITKVIIPGYVTLIEEQAFYSCGDLAEIEFTGRSTDGDLEIGTKAFYSCSSLTSVTLPPNLKTLRKFAFGGNKNLVTVTANCDRPTLEFETYAFHNDNTSYTGYVETLNLGPNMAVVDINGVFGSSKLVSVNVDPANDFYTSIDGVLFDKAVLNLVYFPTGIVGEYTIPDTVTTIGTRVFENKELSSIVIGKNITQIGDQAFHGCRNLTSVTFEEGGDQPLVLGREVFYQCSALTEVTLPERLTTIGDGTFQNCSLLIRIHIPKNVTSIEEVTESEYVPGESSYQDVVRTRVFEYCNSLEEITVDPENKYYGSYDGILYKKNDEGALTELMVCPVNKAGVADIAGTVELLASKAFYNNKRVTEITFSQGLTSNDLEFGVNVFYYCQALTKVTLPEGLKTIGTGAFYYCNSLEEVFIPKTVTLIETYAFGSCANLKTVTFEDGYIYGDVEDPETGEILENQIINYLTIEDGRSVSDQYSTSYYGAFANDPALEEVILPDRLQYLGSYTFANDKGIKKVVLPDNLQVINAGAFYGNSSLEELQFSDAGNLKEIQYQAFYGSNIADLNLPDGLEVLGQYAFAYDKALIDIYIPASVRSMETGSPSSPTSLSGYVFYGCNNVETITFAPNSQLESIGSATFSQLRKVKSVVIPKSVKSIGISAFRWMDSLESLTFEEGSQLETIDNYAFCENPKLTSITLPASVKSIGSYVFQKCYELSSITFEEGSQLESVGNYAFSETAITEIRFPDLADGAELDLGDYLFSKCTDLKTVYFPAAVTSIDGALKKNYSVETLIFSEDSEHFQVYKPNKQYITNIMADGSATAIRYVLGTLDTEELVIPEGFTEISANAFQGQTKVKKIVIPRSIKVIGDRAFANCTSLEEVEFADGIVLQDLGNKVFSGCISLKSATLPDGLTTLPSYTFDGCTSLETVNLPDSITAIGASSSYAFRNCTSLKTIELPANLTTINNYTFQNSGLESITIPANVTKLGTYVFDGCRELKNVNFADASKITSLGSYLFRNCVKLEFMDLSKISGVKSLPTYCFQNCESLTGVLLNANVETIGTRAFENCVNLTEIDLPANVTTINAYAFANTGLVQVTIPAGVKVLGTSKTSASTTSSAYTFYNCKNLVSVTMPDTLTKIGGYVFSGCVNLKNIDLSHMVSIGKEAFKGCVSLTEVDLTGLQKSSSCGTYIFADCTSLSKVTFADVPTSLGAGMFSYCTSLAEITLPTTLTSIPARILEGTAISEIVIPANVTNLGNYSDSESTTAGYCFAYCPNLTKVTFAGNKCAGIGYAVFRGCTNLTSFTIPESVGRIRSFAFADTGITSINIPAAIYELSRGVFAGCDLKSITVASGNEDFVAEGNVLYSIDKTEIYYHPDKLLQIDYNSIADFHGALWGLEIPFEVVIPEGVTEIPDYMFYGFKGLTKVTLPSTLTTIGQYAFYGCTGLKEIEFPASLTTIEQYAFRQSGLENLVIPETVTAIGTYAFAESALKSVTINSVIAPKITVNTSGTTTYAAPVDFKTYMFANCKDLTSVTVTDKFTGMPGYMFYGCTALKNFTLPDTFLRMESYAFSESGIESIVIPESTVYLGGNAFSYSALKEVTILSPLTAVSSQGSDVFMNCEDLTTVTMMYITKITSGWFENCTALTTVNYDPSLITHIYASAFNYCTSLKEITIDVETINYLYTSFEGWTADQTIKLVGSGRAYAALEEDSDWLNNCYAQLVLVE